MGGPNIVPYSQYGIKPGSVQTAIPVLAIITIIIDLPVLMIHGKNRNFPCLCMVSWLVLLNFFSLVNSLIWREPEVKNWWSGVGLCDIEVKLIGASYSGVPTCLICLFANLASLLDTRRTALFQSRARRWRKRAFEFTLCIVVPIIMIITSYIVQPNRYAVFQTTGCVPMYDQSAPSIALFYIWPPIFCIVAAFYCGKVLLARLLLLFFMARPR